MLTDIKAIIFDHDGTLVDSEPVHYACWKTVLARYNRSFEFSEYTSFLNGVASIESAKWLVKRCALSLTPAELYQQKQVELEIYLSQKAFPLMAGARELVEHAANAGYALALASGAGRLEIEHSLNSHGLTRYLAITATKNDVRHNKPAPDVYLLAARKLGIAPSHALAIEDSDAGEASALAAGAWCFRLGKSATAHPRVRNFASLTEMQEQIIRLPDRGIEHHEP